MISCITSPSLRARHPVGRAPRAQKFARRARPVLGVHPEPERVVAARLRRLHHERGPELRAPHAHLGHLHVGDGDVEVLGVLRVPDEPDVGHEERPQVALLRAQVPDALALREDLLVRQQVELALPDHAPAQLQVAVQLRRLVRLVHLQRRREQLGRVLDERREHELEPRALEARRDVQRLRVPPQLAFRLFYLQVGDGRPPDAQVLPRVLVGHPREPQGAHDQRATFPVAPLRVLDRVHAVRDPLARPRLELLHGGVEADGSILPDLVEGLGGEVLEGRVGHRRG